LSRAAPVPSDDGDDDDNDYRGRRLSRTRVRLRMTGADKVERDDERNVERKLGSGT
jgi:hypothetical protein